MTVPTRGPTYGIMLRIPVMNAIPMAALNPIRAMSHRNRKFRTATPMTSTRSPTKYLERRCSMSPMASITLCSIRSGTRAPTILRKSIGSLMKKKEMNTTEKMPTPKETKNEAMYSINDERDVRSNVLRRKEPMALSILKSGPN